MVLRTLRVALAAAALSLVIPAAAHAFSFPLVGWWPMNEGSGQTVRDWSGNGHNGYLGTTPQADDSDPTWVDGVFWGSSTRFFGGDVVTIPASSKLQPQRLTVGAWVRYNGENFGSPTPGIFKTVLSMGDNNCQGGTYGMVTGVDEGLSFYIVDQHGNAIRSPQGPASMWDGKWHHVAGTWDGKTLRFFVDGKRIGNGVTPAAGTLINYELGNPDTAIGGIPGECDGAYLGLQGDVDGVQIWNTAVPVDTVWALLRSLFSTSR